MKLNYYPETDSLYIDLSEKKSGDQLVSIISQESATKLDLKSGIIAYAVIKASNVMIGVD